jgi:hypothetical protein
MAVPVALRPTAIQTAWYNFDTVQTPLGKYFDMIPSKAPGPIVSYDVHTYSRQRGRINSRSGPAYFEDGATDTVVTFMGETWRDAIRIDPETLKDMRAPGESVQNRANFQVADSLRSLRLRFERFVEWMRAEALQGVKSFYPPGLDEEYDELLLTSEACLVANNAYDWSTACADEAAARTNLEGIRGDFTAAKNAAKAVGCIIDTALMNSTTRGYLDQNAVMAGIDVLYDTVILEGQLTRLYGVNIDINDETYVHPITGTSTDYIPDDVVIFLDSNNRRSGRGIVECDAVHTKAPAGHIGLFLNSYEEEAAPGGIVVDGEWTGGPMIAQPDGQYVLQDATAGPA